jgi:hypothetical protein
MDAKLDVKKTGHIRFIEPPGARAVIDIALPMGAQLRSVPHIVARVDELIMKLTNCPCNSGVDIHIRDSVVIPPTQINEQFNIG